MEGCLGRNTCVLPGPKACQKIRHEIQNKMKTYAMVFTLWYITLYPSFNFVLFAPELSGEMKDILNYGAQTFISKGLW